MEERLQKILSRAGFGSRRKCEAIIASGRVKINGQLAMLGNQANPDIDVILVDDKSIKIQQSNVYIVLYKPRGVLSTVHSPDNRPTVLDLIGKSEKIYPVGRLDFDSEGLVLLTNDGKLANQLTHPRYGHDKEYRVLVSHQPDSKQLDAWRRGVVLSDGFQTVPAKLWIESTVGKSTWLRIILHEGHKRQIRLTGQAIGLSVYRIIRIRMGSLKLGSLKPGQWRYLTSEEVSALINLQSRKVFK